MTDRLTDNRLAQLTRVLETARRNPLLELRDPALGDLLAAVAELRQARAQLDELRDEVRRLRGLAVTEKVLTEDAPDVFDICEELNYDTAAAVRPDEETGR